MGNKKKGVHSMKDDDEYELTPHKELIKLRQELERLKKDSISDTSSDDLLGHIKELNHSIKSLTILFKDAAQDISHSDEKIHTVQQNFNPMMERLDMLVEQNKKIAAGIVSVAELIREKMNEPLHPEPAAMPSSLYGSTPSLGPQGLQSLPKEPAAPSFSSAPPMPPMGGLQQAGNLTPPPMSFSSSAGSGSPPLPDPFADSESTDSKKGLFSKFR
ncbi:MAG: hypothetical protein GXP63_00265 [DPANN group archaeon]|nr:hypothetical protein [DPANN group archaeon]